MMISLTRSCEISNSQGGATKSNTECLLEALLQSYADSLEEKAMLLRYFGSDIYMYATMTNNNNNEKMTLIVIIVMITRVFNLYERKKK